MGVSAVDLFFLISGFVIFMSISAVNTGREFAINRIARLYPTYWTCCTFTFGMILLIRALHVHLNHTPHFTIIDYLGNLTMFQYYLGITNLEFPYWTIIIEMLFYLLVLILFKLKLLKHIIFIGCLLNALIIVNYLLVTNHVIPNHTAWFPLLNHFALFFAGMTFYKLATGAIKKLPAYLVILFCLGTQIIIYQFAGADPDHITKMQYAVLLIIYFTIFTLFVNGQLKFIVFKPLIFLGRISFSLYLIHSFFFLGLIGFSQTNLHFSFWAATLIVAVPLAVITATLITLYIEKPMGKKLKSWLYRVFVNASPPRDAAKPAQLP